MENSVNGSEKNTFEKNILQIAPGEYADGSSLDEVKYFDCKLILKADNFTSRKSFFSFGKVLEKAGENKGVTFSSEGFKEAPVEIREVIFVDTPDFLLYHNGFILRRRTKYKNDFPVSDREIVFKFRHSDIQKAAEMDIRPKITGDYSVKFKCQILPLKNKLGGMRMLYSHNVKFPRSAVGPEEAFSIDSLCKLLPAIECIRDKVNVDVKFVNDAIIEEVLQEIGELDFGNGRIAKVSVAIWRTRGEHKPLIAEFSFSMELRAPADRSKDSMHRFEKFYEQLQLEAKEWIELDATKTAVVYRLMGDVPVSKE
jgi:hypothetical protein